MNTTCNWQAGRSADMTELFANHVDPVGLACAMLICAIAVLGTVGLFIWAIVDSAATKRQARNRVWRPRYQARRR